MLIKKNFTYLFRIKKYSTSEFIYMYTSLHNIFLHVRAYTSLERIFAGLLFPRKVFFIELLILASVKKGNDHKKILSRDAKCICLL